MSCKICFNISFWTFIAGETLSAAQFGPLNCRVDNSLLVLTKKFMQLQPQANEDGVSLSFDVSHIGLYIIHYWFLFLLTSLVWKLIVSYYCILFCLLFTVIEFERSSYAIRRTEATSLWYNECSGRNWYDWKNGKEQHTMEVSISITYPFSFMIK